MTAPASLPREGLIFGREPAAISAVVAAGLVLLQLFAFPGLDGAAQAAVLGVVTMGASIYQAAMVSGERVLPLLTGAAKVLLVLLTTFGWAIGDVEQTALLMFVELVVGLFVRTQVVAKVPGPVLSEVSQDYTPANVTVGDAVSDLRRRGEF